MSAIISFDRRNPTSRYLIGTAFKLPSRLIQIALALFNELLKTLIFPWGLGVYSGTKGNEGVMQRFGCVLVLRQRFGPPCHSPGRF
jgi:hypothetical protein